METRAPFVLIGAFVLAAIAAVFGFVYWLNNAAGLGPRATYHVQFDGSVPGLLVGAAVLFNGIRVGEVTELGLAPDNPRRVNAIEAFVTDAAEKGAKVAVGGKRIGNQGNFFEPTVLTDVPENARIMSEEPFGPVAVMLRFKEMDDVLARANKLPYGLASYAFTKDAKVATKVADALESGMVTINHFGIALPETPFGGIKDSGFGHEGGAEGMQVYMQAKFVSHLG